MSRFVVTDRQTILDLVTEYPLAWLIPATGGLAATPLPLLPECDEDGAIVSLLGHVALSNPLVPILTADPRTLILFQGPQGYISPRYVSTPDWGPTWNYAVARFVADVSFVDDETDTALSKLAASLEGETDASWKPAHMGDRKDMLRQYIIAFRASIIDAKATFKLGQDENPAVFSEIVEAIGDTPLSRWMGRVSSPSTG